MILAWMLACQQGEKITDTSSAEVTPAQTARMYRLTHTQWNHAIDDLLGLDGTQYSENFIGETLGSGFDNDADTLVVSSLLFQDYQRAAEGLARKVAGDASVYQQIVPEDLRPDIVEVAFSQRLEAEEGTAVVGGLVSNGTAYNLWSEGVLSMRVELDNAGLYRFSAMLRGTDCGDDVGALFELSVGGNIVLDGFVLGEEEVSVDVPLEPGRYEVAVAFRNDCYDSELGYDRNLIIDYVDVEGGTDLGHSSSSIDDLYGWVDRITTRAYRRNLSSEEKEQWHHVFDQGAELIQSGDEYVDGVRLVLIALLQSPHFLYRIEDTPSRKALSNAELAAKLSFQLCDMPPDEQMRSDVEEGQFFDSYSDHVSRLLNAPCGQKKILDFHHALLHTKGYSNMFKSDELWDEVLNEYMVQEVEAFVEEVVYTENGSLFELYTAPFTMANDRIAALYEQEGASEEFVRIELDPARRSGLLTLSGVLAYQSDAAQSNPIHRGVFINTELLCVDLPPPPDMVEPLPVQEDGQTNRERIDQHTGEGTCGASCHAGLINPPGFAFENYDELGRYRSEEGGLPVDATGSYYFDDHSNFVDGVSFSQALASSKKAHRCYTKKLTQFILGRSLTSEEEILSTEMAEVSLEGASIVSLVYDMVHDPIFTMRGE